MSDFQIKAASVTSRESSVTELFHRINRVIPLEQELRTIPPETPATEALKILEETGFSQLPIVQGRRVLGLFSYRSYSKAIGKFARLSKSFDPLALLVEDCYEKPEFGRVTDEFSKWFDFIDQRDALLVGDPDRLLAIVTAMDILRYLYSVANPFVLIAESETTLRALISMNLDQETLAGCIQNSLTSRRGFIPTTLEDMSLGQYVKMIGSDENWDHFQCIFGGECLRTTARLEQLRQLRNDVFHFKRDLSVEDFEDLVEIRDWLLLKAETMEARREEDNEQRTV